MYLLSKFEYDNFEFEESIAISDSILKLESKAKEVALIEMNEHLLIVKDSEIHEKFKYKENHYYIREIEQV